jgi:dihydroorotate dehydrogenase electron transfer subunit
MYNLAKRLILEGKRVRVILGFNTSSEVFYREQFARLGAEVYVTTVDGSEGIRGFVTDAMRDLDYTYFYACGPEPMLKALHKASTTSGQLSFEERMAVDLVLVWDALARHSPATSVYARKDQLCSRRRYYGTKC